MRIDRARRLVMRARFEERQTAGGLRREIHYETAASGRQVLWWEFEGDALPSPLERLDLVPATLIFKAMRAGADLHVEGPVSGDLLDRLEQFQEIWSLWRPDLYQKVVVTADREIDAPRRVSARMESAVCAFSGGVDGTASTWRHHNGDAGRLARRLHAGVLIRGFDIPLDNDAAWNIAASSALEALEDIQVPLARVSTNWKDDVCTHWEMEFAAGVLGCLRQWDEDVGTLLLGSCESYDSLVTPWGSHPLPTQLLAGQDSTVIYDGGAMTRTAKVALISGWPKGYDQLRVCWQGEITGTNCGVCEKCIRTKLNAIASGVRLPQSLSDRPTKEEVLKIKRFNSAQKKLFEEILREAQTNAIDESIIDVAKMALRRAEGRARARGVKQRIKQRIKATLRP